jgi:DsbC/DsbD-like thiol-disulfide interchange protein
MNLAMMTRRDLLCGGVALALLPSAATASERQYQLRLIAGEPSGGMLRAGIDIELKPGWKTYWRMPGDAGVPPQFDWSGSENVRAVEVLWPAPARFIDAGGETVGYKNRVVFPLRITPEKAAEPVRLQLSIFFGVCKDICIPVKAHAELASWQGDSAAEALLRSFEGRVPAKADHSSPLRVTNASVGIVGDKLELMLTLAGTPPDDLDVFVESTDTSYFRAGQRSGTHGYRITVDGAPDPRRLKGAALKLTMVGKNLALEQDVIVA